jgi:putative aldouronate transport system substrate-binding protein
MKKTRIIALVLVFAMVLSLVLVGCAGNNKAGETTAGTEAVTSAAAETSAATEAFTPDISKEVKLTYYHIGGKTPQEDEVLANLNTKLKAKINATLEVKYLSWGDAWTQGPLLFASGENFDMIFCAPWFLFSDQGRKGAFKELNDILPKYAPKIWSECPAVGWEQASLDGKIYAIPQYAVNFSMFHGMTYREDVRKKYNVPEIKKLTDFEAYFDAIKKNEPNMTPWAVDDQSYANLRNMYIRENTNLTYQGTEEYGFWYDMTEANPKVIYGLSIPQFDDYVVLAKKWADAGYWSKNALSNKTKAEDAFKAGTSGLASQNTFGINECYKALKENNPAAEAGVYINWSKDGKVDRRAVFSNGVAINANSENPERAVMLVEALMYDPEIYEAGVFGIEGKTFVKDANGLYQKPAGAKDGESWNFGSMYGMGITNYKMEPLDTTKDHPDYTAKYYNMDYYNQVAVDCALTGFSFDNTSVKAETAALTEVNNQYFPILALGLSKDPTALLAEFRTKCKDAGYEKVQAEFQKQVDAFIAAKKK